MPVKIKKQESSPVDFFGKDELSKLLDKSLVTLDKEYAKESYCLEIVGNNNYYTGICSLGNISATVGGAKSRKTFFSTMMLSALSSNGIKFGFKGKPNGKRALFIDTEQAPFHVQKVRQRVFDITHNDDGVDFLYLRHCVDMDTRLALIDHYLISHGELYCFIVIDGVVDMVNDYNNQAECRKVVSMVMSWSDIYNTHINCVVHTNKDGGYARGHLGAELTNKSEIVFRTKKEDNEDTTVSCDVSRGKSFEPFDFNVRNGLPVRDLYPVGYMVEKEKTLINETNEEIGTFKEISAFEIGSPF